MEERRTVYSNERFDEPIMTQHESEDFGKVFIKDTTTDEYERSTENNFYELMDEGLIAVVDGKRSKVMQEVEFHRDNSDKNFYKDEIERLNETREIEEEIKKGKYTAVPPLAPSSFEAKMGHFAVSTSSIFQPAPLLDNVLLRMSTGTPDYEVTKISTKSSLQSETTTLPLGKKHGISIFPITRSPTEQLNDQTLENYGTNEGLFTAISDEKNKSKQSEGSKAKMQKIATIGEEDIETLSDILSEELKKAISTVLPPRISLQKMEISHSKNSTESKEIPEITRALSDISLATPIRTREQQTVYVFTTKSTSATPLSKDAESTAEMPKTMGSSKEIRSTTPAKALWLIEFLPTTTEKTISTSDNKFNGKSNGISMESITSEMTLKSQVMKALTTVSSTKLSEFS